MTITEQLARLITTFGAEWVMWLLVGLSVASVSVMAERWWFHFRRRPDMDGLLRAVERGDADGAPGSCIEASVTRELLRAREAGRPAAIARRAAAIERERPGYERGLAFLGTLGNNAPFVGLLGTVLGVIRAFADLSGDIQGGAAVVMAGISEALVATAVGLAVALPAVVAFNVFKGKSRDALRRVEVLAEAVLAHPDGGPATATATDADAG